ncbi:MAG: TrbG/VirB9 family P-type conjugative transfer protein [Proteobacteria bacterium]|nr:TrbG/VirB9 family P-type conjugative transfer protein [Pseudomonadota bacterium]
MLNKYSKHILVFFLLVLSALPSWAGIVDEGAMSTPPAPGPEQVLKQKAYLGSFQKIFEESETYENISKFEYSDTNIIKVMLRENMQTTLIFPFGEEIINVEIGDRVNFKYVANKKDLSLAHIAMIYSILPGADTNLTAFGKSGNIYSFYLRSYSVEANVPPDFRIHIMDASVQDRVAAIKQAEANASCQGCDEKDKPAKQAKAPDGDYLRSLPEKIDPSQINMAYITADGASMLQPLRIFDDGYFTYFEFAPDNMDQVEGVPVVYKVVDGYDTLVNTRIQKGSVIAESINERWTIRRGDQYLCVKRLKAHAQQ